MTIRELIAVLEGMDQDRTVISTVEPGKKIRGVGTFIDDARRTDGQTYAIQTYAVIR